MAGWRRSQMGDGDLDVPFLTLAPDWLAEVLSPGTEKFDRAEKLTVYAHEGVAWVWLLNPRQRTLEILKLGADGRWVLRGTYQDDVHLRAEPFEAIEFHLGSLWRS
jgi:Uma2 family endonuclease